MPTITPGLVASALVTLVALTCPPPTDDPGCDLPNPINLTPPIAVDPATIIRLPITYGPVTDDAPIVVPQVGEPIIFFPPFTADPAWLEAPAAGDRWLLLWDDRVDGGLDPMPKACAVDLVQGGRHLSGAFARPVSGPHRIAAFSGEMIDGAGATLIVLRQDERDYTCLYHGAADGGGFAGTWFDTNGARGDFRMDRR